MLALYDTAVDGWTKYSCKCAVIGYAGHDRVKVFADVSFHHRSGDDLSHLSLDLALGAFLLVTMLSDPFQVVGGIWRRLAGKGRFHKSLDDNVRITPVGRR